jgi:glycosyltransferase 2 family protein
MSKTSLKKWLLFTVKAAVTIILIWLVLRKVDMADMKRHFAAIGFDTVFFALALLAAQSVLAAIRWRIVMRLFDRVLAFAISVRIYFEGLFFNQALPSTVGGDGIRIYRVYRLGLPFGAAFNGVLLDRVAGFISLILLVAAAQPLLRQRIDNEQALLAFMGIMLLGLSAIIALLALASLPDSLGRWRVVRGMMKLSLGGREMLKSIRIAAPVLGYSLVGHALMVFAVYLIAMDIGLAVSFVDCLIIVPSVMLVATIPISIAGWGVRESAMVTAFGLLGAPTDAVAALSVAFGLCLIAVGLPGGILWFLNPDHHVADTAEIAEMQEKNRAE